jgi:large subunit ribosomal protein L17
MRHRRQKKTLDRTAAPRQLMLRNLATSLILYERVTTTDARAKAIRALVERVITVGQRGDLTSRRRLRAVLPVRSAVDKVLEELRPRYQGRRGGYSRIVKLGRRQGDAAAMVRLELL